ncbi:MAG: hypothetical protein WD097_06425 [Balneolales bacterium]
MYSLAIHEAAHCVAERHEGRYPKYVTIIPDEEMGAAGHMMQGGTSTGSKDVRILSTRTVISRLFVLMAGPIAADMVTIEFDNPLEAVKNSCTDFKDITDYLESIERFYSVRTKEIKEFRQELSKQFPDGHGVRKDYRVNSGINSVTRREALLESGFTAIQIQRMGDIFLVANNLMEKHHLTNTELNQILTKPTNDERLQNHTEKVL